MNTIYKSEIFSRWFNSLADTRARGAILARIRRAELGNFGDCKPVGEGVSEMRIHVGKGYRVYFMRDGERVYLLLAGGDKASQQKDIATALTLARERRELQ